MITCRQSFSNIYGDSSKAINVAHTYIRQTGFGILAAAALLTACALPVHAALPAPPSPVSEKTIQNTVWGLRNWTRPDNSTRAVPPQEIPATLEFAPENTIIGYTGCNTISGKYSFVQDNLSIQTASMGRRACFTLPDSRFEREYARALGTIAQTRMLGGSPQRLQIILANGERLEFLPLEHNIVGQANSALRVTQERIRNTKWTLKSWKPANGDMRQLPTGEKSLSLNFFDQGRADGYTGCNSMQASYTFAAGKLSVQPGVTTLKLCQETSRDQQGNRIRDNSSYILERDYLNALSQIKSADIQIASSTSQQLRLILDNRDALEFERSPGWMTEGYN
ncbi:META domain-containing protein [Paraburkholderia sp. RL17-337-BIB-A]|uniref:META domain-containing protein n=1 Tax=Paraburkholderia sp. RL17-337-BIB-A TaxID=3031636 RepID=UPI0038BB9BD7